MRLTMLVLSLLLLCSCAQRDDSVDVPVHPNLQNCVAIKIYRINWPYKDAFGPMLVLNDGTLNPERIPLDGVKLNPQQTMRMLNMFCGEHPVYEQNRCFLPHHSFEFLDQHDQRIGSMDLCFMCSVHQSDLEEIANYIDLPGLKKMLGELNIPIDNPDW